MTRACGCHDRALEGHCQYRYHSDRGPDPASNHPVAFKYIMDARGRWGRVITVAPGTREAQIARISTARFDLGADITFAVGPIHCAGGRTPRRLTEDSWMIALDMKTVLFSHLLANFLITLVLFPIWIENRRRFDGIGLWFADYLLQAFGILAMFIGHLFGNLYLVCLGAPLTALGILLAFLGLERFTGRKGPQAHNLLLLAVSVVIQIYFTLFKPNLTARIINLYGLYLIYSAQVSYLLFFRVGRDLRRVTRNTGYVFLGFVTVSLIRIVDVVLTDRGNSFLGSGAVPTLLVLSATLLVIMLTFTLISMINTRLILQAMDDAKERGLLVTNLRQENDERRKTQDALRESEERFQQLFDNMGDGVAVFGALDHGEDFEFVDINRTGQMLCGIRRDEALGRSAAEKFAPAGQSGFFDIFKRVLLTGVPECLCVALRSDGGAVRWVENYVYRLPTGLIVDIFKDTTEQRRSAQEKEALREQLLQAQKMDAVGRLAGGVAHDFNNMLSVIMGHAELAMMEIDPKVPLYSHLAQILAATKHSSDITKQLLAFARRQVILPLILDINEEIEKILKMLRRLVGEGITFSWKPVANLWFVRMDPSQVDQIIANLVINARDAIEATGNIVIETKNVDEAVTDFRGKRHGAEPGQYVMFSVHDDGCGIDEKTMPVIFEPFFTTKDVGKGTGLGLPTVYGIVKQNNGFIDVESSPGEGTTFRIYIPRDISHADAPSRHGENSEIPLGNETVLLVEDDRRVLDMVSKLLGGLGYKVLQAEGPEQAVRMAEEFAGTIHLLLSDVVMPRTNGRELFSRIEAMRPGIRCLFLSGYTADVIARHGILEQGVNFLQKPFSLSALAVKIRDVMR